MSFLIKSWGLVPSNFCVDCRLFGLNMFTEKVSNNGGIAGHLKCCSIRT